MPIREKELAAARGLTRDVFRKMRSSGVLVEGLHWSSELTGIEYTAAGLEELERLMPGSIATAADAERLPSGTGLVEVRITRLLRGNDRRMLADHDGRQVVVQVRSSANFMPDMVIEARPGVGSLYYYEGRLPRWKGRM